MMMVELKKYIQLIICISFIVLFMFLIGPLLEKLPLFKSSVIVIKNRNINAGSLYYTETDQFGPANSVMNNSIRYSPELKK